VAALAAPSAVRAGVTVTWSHVGSNFQATVSGSFSSAELAEAQFNFTQSSTERATFDSSPSFFSLPAADHRRHFFQSAKVTFSPSFIRLNSYSGNSRSGDPFGFFYNGTYLFIALADGYQPGAAINSSLVSWDWGTSLVGSFTFGEVVKLNGSPSSPSSTPRPFPSPRPTA